MKKSTIKKALLAITLTTFTNGVWAEYCGPERKTIMGAMWAIQNELKEGDKDQVKKLKDFNIVQSGNYSDTTYKACARVTQIIKRVKRVKKSVRKAQVAQVRSAESESNFMGLGD